MKKIIFLLFFLVPGMLAAAAWPRPTGYVNDFARVITPSHSQGMERVLTVLEEKTGIQIAVVTIPKVENADINGAAVDLFKAWGIGKKGKDNGILFLASIEDHMARIELGYGLEGAVTDGQAGEILRKDMIPLFKEGNYSQGLINGVHSIVKLIMVKKGLVEGDAEPVAASASREAPADWIVFLILFSIVIVIVFLADRFDKKHPGRGGFYGGGWGSGSGGWGSGGGSGFGGFGGGSSGGGGASGSW